MGIQAGAEMTSFEMRFIALRCKDTIAPTGTIAQGVGARQVNSRGFVYEDKYGLTTSERVYGTVKENQQGNGPCYLQTSGIDKEQEENLLKAYLNMAPSQTLKWIETGELPGEQDVYVAPSQIRRFGLKTGDILTGNTRIKTQGEKFSALLYVSTINGLPPEEAMKRKNFEDLTPIFPNERIRLENPGCSTAMRVVDLISPIGKGQRGMIVSPPKAGKTTLLKEIALSVQKTEPDCLLYTSDAADE